jgi:hypothetical protein
LSGGEPLAVVGKLHNEQADWIEVEAAQGWRFYASARL